MTGDVSKKLVKTGIIQRDHSVICVAIPTSRVSQMITRRKNGTVVVAVLKTSIKEVVAINADSKR